MRAAHPSRNKNEPLVFTGVEKEKILAIFFSPRPIPVLGDFLSANVSCVRGCRVKMRCIGIAAYIPSRKELNETKRSLD
jgi:hypothetical protein